MLIHKDTKRSEIYYEVFKTIAFTNEWGISDMDVKVFGTLLYEYKELSLRYTDEITKTLFLNKPMKDKLVISLGTTYNSFMNSLTRLKKLGLLDENTLINPEYLKITIPDAPIVPVTIQFYMK